MSNINANDLQQSIFNAVDTIVSRRIKEVNYDKTIIGIIDSSAGVKNGKPIYKIEYAGGFFYAFVLDSNDTYVKNTKVYVFVPQGDFSKEKIILGKASTINAGNDLNLVASAMDNYSILGSNPIKLKDPNKISAGVRSYHAKISELNNDPISHRYNILYGNENEEDDFVEVSNKEALLAYAQDGTAIMIRADFRTDLPTEQRNLAAARYGLSFKLKFKNENAGWGETQWDVLTNVGKQVTGIIEVPNFFDDQSKNLFDIAIENDELINSINENNFSNFIADDGDLSQQICLIEELYRIFSGNELENNLKIIEETVKAYVILLKELQTCSDVEDLKNRYEEWKTVKVETEEFKTIPCLLDSNKMLGAPLYFKKWVTQYAIFEADLTNFVGLEEIALFKENFLEDESKDNNNDIFVQNIQLLILEPLDTVSGDYALKVEALSTGSVLSSEEDSAIFTATLTRKIYEDLSINSNANFYWFKEDPSVQIGDSGYHLYGGKGWYLLHSIEESKRIFKTTFAENFSKKNNYKCVAVYKENEDTNIILECPFIVYNTVQGELIELQSDLGTVFQFDVGTPTVTCLISGQETSVKKNLNNEIIADYEFYWSLITEDGQEILLYDNLIDNFDWTNLDIDNFSTYQMQEVYLKNIKFFDSTETEIANSLKATRLQYPMMNINTGSKITIKCAVVLITRDTEKNRINQGSEQLVFENRKGVPISGYRIVFEHDNQVFQYDEYGNSPILKNKLDFQEILPIRAKLVGPNGLEIMGTNIRVDWIFPIEDTMIIPPENLLTINPETGLLNLLKNSNNCTFSIADIYNPNAINNQITCRIKFKNNNYYKDTNLFFRKIGENGTNGTDIAVRISPISSAAILDEQPLTLYTFTDNKVKKGLLNNNIYSAISAAKSNVTLTGANGYLQTQVYQKGQEINGYDSAWNIAGNPSEAANKMSNIFNIAASKNIQWPVPTNLSNPYRIQIIKSHITIKDIGGNSKDYYGYYPLPVIEYQTEKPSPYATSRIAIDKKTYLKEITYNADGRNPIYNHNQGLKLINLPIGSTVQWVAKGGRTNNEDTPDFGLTFEKDSPIKNTNSTLTSNLGNKTEAFVYVVPKDDTTGSSTNNRIEATIFVKNKKYAVVYAPIIITLDTFGLASLNAWDGNSVTIDDEGGYIVAPQIGAGEKDTNNRFTGIVMGKTETYTGGGDTEKQTGLFGYADGLQSIFLDAKTGAATFGLPDVEGGHYQNMQRTKSDDYGEGRIELRPSGVSKIGGWRLGRRSLYYITDNNLTLKEISSSYGDPWAKKSQHEKDIGHEHRGILLNAAPLPYISIKGKPLTVGDSSQFDINNSSGNAALANGDSLELVLDPNQKDFFTMFRHYKENNQWARTPLVGIDAMGRFYTNALKDKETSLNMNYVPGFGKTSTQQKYLGLYIGYGSSTIIKNFIDNEKNNNTGTVYISGGKTDNEYARPISIHGKSIQLYSSENNSQNTTTDANIQISASTGSINVGSNTSLQLNRSENSLLKTAGALDTTIGGAFNATTGAFNATTGALNATVGGTLTAIVSGAFYHKGQGEIDLFSGRTNSNNGDTKKPYLRIKDGTSDDNQTIILGFNGTKDDSDNPQNKIRLMHDHGDWKTTGHLILQGITDGNFTSANPQILLQAGSSNNAAQLFLNFRTRTHTTSNTQSWFGITREGLTDGIFLRDIVEKVGNTDVTKSYCRVEIQRVSIDTEQIGTNAEKINLTAQETNVTANKIIFNKTADYLQFGATEFSGKGKTLQIKADDADEYNKYYYKTTTDVTTLKEAIDICLKAAGRAYSRALTAESNAKTYAETQAETAESNAKSYAKTKAEAAETYAHGLVYTTQNGQTVAKWATAGHTHSGYASSSHSHSGTISYNTANAGTVAAVVSIHSGSGGAHKVNVSVS